MSNNNEQNGRQPPLPQQTAPSTTASTAPTDPRIRNTTVTTSEQHNKKCRDFLWGICTKGAQCRFRHELDVESMKDILKFCHDFQNRTGCTRPDCTYLHTTREEKKPIFDYWSDT
ncbi:hypothetical protein PYW07_000345 [Mythimna separata]|uniref:C3H1-type domain-containing protein n=1 Tax=Mythimna separata TaxID=271217 RepID=A0AAD7Z320_MYTSE|nr:hypothetical protein PYW07_000345 [Mythimna separata]